MSKYEYATIIGLILVSKGLQTYSTLTISGNDKIIKSFFGCEYKGKKLVIDGLNNIITIVTNGNYGRAINHTSKIINASLGYVYVATIGNNGNTWRTIDGRLHCISYML